MNININSNPVSADSFHQGSSATQGSASDSVAQATTNARQEDNITQGRTVPSAAQEGTNQDIVHIRSRAKVLELVYKNRRTIAMDLPLTYLSISAQTCVHCGMTFPNKSQRDVHVQQHHSDGLAVQYPEQAEKWKLPFLNGKYTCRCGKQYSGKSSTKVRAHAKRCYLPTMN